MLCPSPLCTVSTRGVAGPGSGLGAGKVSIVDKRERLAMAVYTCSEPLYGLHSLCVPVCHGHRISVCQIARSEHAELVPRREETQAHCRRQLSSVRSRGVERRRRGGRVRAGPAARRDPGALQKAVEQCAVERRGAVEGGACPSWSRGAKRPGRGGPREERRWLLRGLPVSG